MLVIVQFHLQSFVPVKSRATCCAGQEFITIAPNHLSQHIQPGREKIGNPPYHASCLPVWPVPGKVECDSSSLSESLMLLILVTSSLTSVTKQRISSAQAAGSPWLSCCPWCCSSSGTPLSTVLECSAVDHAGTGAACVGNWVTNVTKKDYLCFYT